MTSLWKPPIVFFLFRVQKDRRVIRWGSSLGVHVYYRPARTRKHNWTVTFPFPSAAFLPFKFTFYFLFKRDLKTGIIIFLKLSQYKLARKGESYTFKGTRNLLTNLMQLKMKKTKIMFNVTAYVKATLIEEQSLPASSQELSGTLIKVQTALFYFQCREMFSVLPVQRARNRMQWRQVLWIFSLPMSKRSHKLKSLSFCQISVQSWWPAPIVIIIIPSILCTHILHTQQFFLLRVSI